MACCDHQAKRPEGYGGERRRVICTKECEYRNSGQYANLARHSTYLEKIIITLNINFIILRPRKEFPRIYLFHASVFSAFQHIPLQVSTPSVHIIVDKDRHVMTFASNNRFGLGDMEKKQGSEIQQQVETGSVERGHPHKPQDVFP